MSTLEPSRLFPRWVHVWSIITVVITTSLLILGVLVTTFKVGMADPIWPTEPWALALVNLQEAKPGYLIEHTHRLFGFLVGGCVSVLVISLWVNEPNKVARIAGVLGLVAFIALFGQFHGQMTAQAKQPDFQQDQIVWPKSTIQTMLGVYACTFSLAFGRWLSGAAGSGTRLISVIVLACVMIQGMLGGLRVFMDALVGTELAAFHGSFAQIVFSLLISIAVLTRKPSTSTLPADTQRRLKIQAIALIVFTYTQIVWGAWIRHAPGPIGNRLHLIFAFLVVGLATLLMKQALNSPEAKTKLKLPLRFLMAFITIQIILGVEAWIGKFMSGTLPEFETITVGKAVVRSIHAHTGTWILAVSVICGLLIRNNQPITVGPNDDGHVDWSVSPQSEPALAGR